MNVRINEGELKLKVQDAGVYRMVITGDDVEGHFKVTWNISRSY